MADIKSVYCLRVRSWPKMLCFFVFTAVALARLCQLQTNQPLNGIGIVLDAGHGGIDSGAEYNGVKEKDINLALCVKVGELLTENGAVVIFTRQEDTDYYTRGKGGKRNDLLKRVALIDDADAKLFVSIHCNASPDKRWHGAQVYYNPSQDANYRLAQAVQQALRRLDAKNRRAEKADDKILLLKNAVKPGVMVEAGFLSNEQDAALLKNPVTQKQIAASIVEGICQYVVAQQKQND